MICSGLFRAGSLCLIWAVGSLHCVSVSQCQDVGEESVLGAKVERLGSNLMTVFQDSKNNYWFSTLEDGVYRTDGSSIIHFTTEHGLSHNRVDEIVEDKAGLLYFNTGAGVDKFDGQRFSRLPIELLSNWRLEDDDLWFKSLQFDGTVLRYDGKKLYLLALPKVAIGEKFRAENPSPVSLYGVYTIYRDRNKHIWFGTAAVGVCRYDGTSFDWISSSDVNELHNGPANGVRSILQDDQQNYWFTTMHRYRVAENNSPLPAPVEREGNFFRVPGIGSLDGDPAGNFHEYMSIIQDDRGGVWMATYGAGVFHYDGRKINNYLIRDGESIVTLFSIYRDRQGKIWAGTHEHGAYFFDGQAFVPFVPNPSNKVLANDDLVRSVQDRPPFRQLTICD